MFSREKVVGGAVGCNGSAQPSAKRAGGPVLCLRQGLQPLHEFEQVTLGLGEVNRAQLTVIV
jgi:hypothetical protein